MYKKLNVNPKNKKAGDCVVRAFSIATGESWDKTLTDLFQIALKIKFMPNDKETYSKYAESMGFIVRKVELKNGHKPTVKSFAEDNKSGVYILRVANHLVTVINGEYIDSWDSGYKSVYMYWVKES